MFKKFIILGIVGIIGLALFTKPVAGQESASNFTNSGAVLGTLLSVETFDRQDAWEHYSNPMGVELGVENGIYRAYTMNGGYVWGLNEVVYRDVILEVEATPLNTNFGNGFGVMCRASVNGDGYYFMINANGLFTIAMGDGDYVLPLVDWQESDAIRSEIDRNVIRASCIGDELQMFVNNELVAEVTDDTFASGFAGLSVAGSANTDADVAFDNVAIYSPLFPR
jgi:hypothetical protein